MHFFELTSTFRDFCNGIRSNAISVLTNLCRIHRALKNWCSPEEWNERIFLFDDVNVHPHIQYMLRKNFYRNVTSHMKCLRNQPTEELERYKWNGAEFFFFYCFFFVRSGVVSNQWRRRHKYMGPWLTVGQLQMYFAIYFRSKMNRYSESETVVMLLATCRQSTAVIQKSAAFMQWHTHEYLSR